MIKKIGLLTALLLVPVLLGNLASTANAQFVVPVWIVTESLPNAIAGQSYSYQVQASGGVAPYTWATISTSYPSACCVMGIDTYTGVFNTQSSSTVLGSNTGTYYWTIEVTDSLGSKSQKTLWLTISPASQPVLVLSTTFAVFNYKKGDPVPLALPAHITNSSSTQTINYNISVPNQPTWLNTGYATTTLSLSPLQSAGIGVSIDPNNLNIGSYNTTIYFSGNFANSPASIAVTLNVSAPSGPISQYKNVLHNGTVYYVADGVRYPYTSAGAFLSYGFNSWSTIVPATASDIVLPVSTYTPNGSSQATTYFLPPRNGSLINDNGTVYIITNGTRAGFTSEAVFKGLGFSFSNVMPGDTSFMVTLAPVDSSSRAHPDGTVVNIDGTLYLIRSGQRIGIPSMAVFTSWGLKLNEAVIGNSHDRTLPQGSVIQTRMQNQFGI